MLLNLIYIAVNDSSLKNSSTDTLDEEVSTFTVTSICYQVHRVLIQKLDFFNRMISCVDPAQTLTFLVLLHVVVIVQIMWLDVSLSLVVWTVYALNQIAPLVYPKIEQRVKAVTTRLPLFKNLIEK